MKIYATSINAGVKNEIPGIAVSEEGVVLAGHVSSTIEWLKHDLGCKSGYGDTIFKHNIYNKKYGEGNWTIEWVDVLPEQVRKKMEARANEENHI